MIYGHPRPLHLRRHDGASHLHHAAVELTIGPGADVDLHVDAGIHTFSLGRRLPRAVHHATIQATWCEVIEGLGLLASYDVLDVRPSTADRHDVTLRVGGAATHALRVRVHVLFSSAAH